MPRPFGYASAARNRNPEAPSGAEHPLGARIDQRVRDEDHRGRGQHDAVRDDPVPDVDDRERHEQRAEAERERGRTRSSPKTATQATASAAVAGLDRADRAARSARSSAGSGPAAGGTRARACCRATRSRARSCRTRTAAGRASAARAPRRDDVQEAPERERRSEHEHRGGERSRATRRSTRRTTTPSAPRPWSCRRASRTTIVTSFTRAAGPDGLPRDVRVDPVALPVRARQRLHRHLRRAGRRSAGARGRRGSRRSPGRRDRSSTATRPRATRLSGRPIEAYRIARKFSISRSASAPAVVTVLARVIVPDARLEHREEREDPDHEHGHRGQQLDQAEALLVAHACAAERSPQLTA